MADKKYELVKDENIDIGGGRLLYRIRALEDLFNIRKGELGGFVASEKNLSQEGECWIYDNAKVFDNARVYEDAIVWDEALIFENAKIYGDAYIGQNGIVRGNARVHGYAYIGGGASIQDDSEIYGPTNIEGNALTLGKTMISGVVSINDGILKDACIKSREDCILLQHILDSKEIAIYRTLTGYFVSCSWFSDTLEEFEKYVDANDNNCSDDSKYFAECRAVIKLAKIHFGIEK